MKIKDFDEKFFIKSILGKYATTAELENFDDCIIIDLSKFTSDCNAPYLVYSIDHPSFIKRKISSDENYRFYGRWAAACTCGDIFAMGAIPKGFAMDLSVPLNAEVEDIENIVVGIKQTLDCYNIEFEGGNLDNNNLETVCMAWGIVDKDKIIKRSGAKVGDLIVATGRLGVGWSGYISEKLDIYQYLDEDTRNKIDNYKLYPLAPFEAMNEVFNTGAITSGMDLTDGIVEFMYTILERNGLGVEVELNRLPIIPEVESVAKHLNIDSRLFALDPGYDTPITHGWTISPEKLPLVLEIFKKHGAYINVYGTVTDSNHIILKSETDDSIDIPKFWDDQFKKGDTVTRWLDFIKYLSRK